MAETDARPLPARRKWMTVAIATVVQLVSFWAVIIGMARSTAEEGTEVGASQLVERAQAAAPASLGEGLCPHGIGRARRSSGVAGSRPRLDGAGDAAVRCAPRATVSAGGALLQALGLSVPEGARPEDHSRLAVTGEEKPTSYCRHGAPARRAAQSVPVHAVEYVSLPGGSPRLEAERCLIEPSDGPSFGSPRRATEKVT